VSTPLDGPEVARGARDIDSCTERLVTPGGRATAPTTYAANPDPAWAKGQHKEHRRYIAVIWQVHAGCMNGEQDREAMPGP